MRKARVDRQAQRTHRVRGVRRTTTRPRAQKAKAVAHLGNPILELYEELGNLRATWIDAVFWFAMGILGNALGETVWDAMKHYFM